MRSLCHVSSDKVRSTEYSISRWQVAGGRWSTPDDWDLGCHAAMLPTGNLAPAAAAAAVCYQQAQQLSSSAAQRQFQPVAIPDALQPLTSIQALDTPNIHSYP